MARPHLYLFVGYPGAGKTTVAQLIEQHTGATHLWADRERQAMFGKAALTPAETDALYARLNTQTAELLAGGQSVIFDTNFNFRKDRDLLRQLATENGADTTIIWLQTPVELARRRATEHGHHDTRVWGNMSTADFERISAKLEPPTPDEQAIIVDGSEINEKSITAVFTD